MKKMSFLGCFVMLLLLSACSPASKDDDKLIEQVAVTDLSVILQDKINNEFIENGTFLINTDKNQYLYLNHRNVLEGESGGYFTNINADLLEDTLIIKFDEISTQDPTDEGLNEQIVIYKLLHSDQFEYISVYKNGDEVPIDTVFGLDE